MTKYKFEQFKIEIVDPTVEFITLLSWDLDTKTGSIECLLTTPNGSKFGVELTGIDLPTVNEGTIDAKGQLKLDEYKV